ncbi:MAG: methylated-DNA--[protein]-cysteine S-methyltransferase [Clostridiaceae bacterium]
MENIFFYETSIGKVMFADDGYSITKLYYRDKGPIDKEHVIKETELIKKAYGELVEYLEGKRKSFDIPLAPKGTEFQMNVWKALQEIPYGETRTYKEIAETIGNPKACRAVGLSNNRNPISIIIPCHRVIGSNGKLVGYAGGLEVKEYLLKLENQSNKGDI